MTKTFTRLQLPDPSDGSKAERATACMETLTDAELAPAAERILEEPPEPAVRYAIEEALWRDQAGVLRIPTRTRHEVADALPIEDLWDDGAGFMALLGRLWVIDGTDVAGEFAAFFGHQPNTLRREIEQHVLRNPGDWSTRELFDQLGAFGCTDRRFGLFLEGLSSSAVLPNASHQLGYVEAVNAHLRPIGGALEEVESDDGYPRFELIVAGVAPRRPKNIIFASSVKPDIRIPSALDNDIEVVDPDDDLLIYSRPLDAGGLTWSQLELWWAAEYGENEAKRRLYSHLRKAIPDESPPQRRLFDQYHHLFARDIASLPALLPEVWFCWDPKTVRQRGQDALLGFRADFLLLLPSARRVILEVDGKTHYADDDGRADPCVYAHTMASSRDLTLSGYEVYRFGAYELTAERASQTVDAFFRRLFESHQILLSPSTTSRG